MQWTDDISIETPDQIELSLEIAGLGSRFFARLIDWRIKPFTLLVVASVTVIALAMASVGLDIWSFTPLTMALIGLGYAFFVGFDIYFGVRHSGQTPGKKIAGLRALREAGAPLDFRSASIR